MDEIISPKACQKWLVRPATLSVHDDSHGITKSRPKVRIVHIFAPKIIKTNAANFRELVQRLTGNPTKKTLGKRARPGMAGAHEEMGSRHGYRDSWRGGDRMEGELEGEIRWMEENSGGLLGGMGDVDGFFHGLSHFPLLPIGCSSNVDAMGGPQVP